MASEANPIEQYIDKVWEGLKGIQAQEVVIRELALRIVESYLSGGMLHVFGTGHSHMLAEEVFYRAGGLGFVNAMLEESIMLHTGARKSTDMERVAALGEILIAHYNIQPPDVLIIVSNSGSNALPVELAVRAKERGVTVGVVTSRAASASAPRRHPSRQCLADIGDVVLDNLCPPGDAVVDIGSYKVCALSTVTGVVLLQTVMSAVTLELVQRGVDPPVFTSANVEGGDQRNELILNRFRGRVRHF